RADREARREGAGGVLRAPDGGDEHAVGGLGEATQDQLPGRRRPGAGVRAVRQDRVALHAEPRPDSHGVQERGSGRRTLGSGVARFTSRPGAELRYPAVAFLESAPALPATTKVGGDWGDRLGPPNVSVPSMFLIRFDAPDRAHEV